MTRNLHTDTMYYVFITERFKDGRQGLEEFSSNINETFMAVFLMKF